MNINKTSDTLYKIQNIGFVIVFMVIFTGCDRKVRPDLDETRYEQILIEIELIYALHMQVMDDSLTQSLLDKVWDKYDITEADFLKNHALFEQDLQGQMRRMQRLSEFISEEQLRLESRLYELRDEERRANENETQNNSDQ